MPDDEDVRFAEFNQRFDEMWTRAFASFEAISFAVLAAVLICAAGAALVLLGVAQIYVPAAKILAGVGMLYLAFVLSTHGPEKPKPAV